GPGDVVGGRQRLRRGEQVAPAVARQLQVGQVQAVNLLAEGDRDRTHGGASRVRRDRHDGARRGGGIDGHVQGAGGLAGGPGRVGGRRGDAVDAPAQGAGGNGVRPAGRAP